MARDVIPQREPLTLLEVLKQLTELARKFELETPTNVHEIKVSGPDSQAKSKRKILLH